VQTEDLSGEAVKKQRKTCPLPPSRRGERKNSLYRPSIQLAQNKTARCCAAAAAAGAAAA